MFIRPLNAALVLALVFLLSACAATALPTQVPSPTSPEPISEEDVAGEGSPPTTSDRAYPYPDIAAAASPLLERYYRLSPLEDELGADTIRDVTDFEYFPRQSSLEAYRAWDILRVPYPEFPPSDGRWLFLELRRSAQVALLLPMDIEPTSWLASWERAAPIYEAELAEFEEDYRVFRKKVAPGELVLPAVPDTEYLLLFAEADGKASIEPPLPANAGERPQANRTCPAWLHDSWLAKGPDGRSYRTWHPQIDPVYWCYYGHEHGTDPALVGYQASFGYTAFYNNRQNERHEGFKGFAFSDDGVHWYVNVHATTGMLSRVCVRFHTVVFAAKDAKSGELLLELAYKGDFGSLRSNDEDAEFIQPKLANCPNQLDIAEETEAVKEVRVRTSDEYEAWRGGTNTALGMSFDEEIGMSIDIQNPMTACNGLRCEGAIDQDSKGNERSIIFLELAFDYQKDLDLSDGQADGYFYTDPYGKIQADNSKNTMRQFIAPGFSHVLDGQYGSHDAWGLWYELGRESMMLELEDSIGKLN